MAENKRSFLLYVDVWHTVKKLDDKQAGILFKHILGYVNDENPELKDFLLEIAFEPIKQSLKRDLKRYEAICLRNKENGAKGGRPKEKPKKPSGLYGNPKNPSEPDNDNDIDIDIDNVIEEYNRGPFSKIQKITDLRKKHLQTRIKENGIDAVIGMIKRASISDFLCGVNDRHWRADFDWLMNPNNYVKVIEGKFDNKNNKSAKISYTTIPKDVR